MKTVLKWLNNSIFLTYLLGAVLLVALISLGVWWELSKSDWGTWFGSIGAVGTLIGTIHLARTETRRREQNELTIARLHATSLLSRIEEAIVGIHEAAVMLQLARNGDRDPAFYAICASKLESIQFWSIEDVTPLAPMPRHVAIKLANVVGIVHSTRQFLKGMGRLRMISELSQRTQVAMLSNLLNSALTDLDAAASECRMGAIVMRASS